MRGFFPNLFPGFQVTKPAVIREQRDPQDIISQRKSSTFPPSPEVEIVSESKSLSAATGSVFQEQGGPRRVEQQSPGGGVPSPAPAPAASPPPGKSRLSSSLERRNAEPGCILRRVAVRPRLVTQPHEACWGGRARVQQAGGD